MAHMTVAKLAGCVRVCWSGFADHKPPGCLSVPAMGPVPLHTAECIYNWKPHSCTHTLYLCTISRFSLQRALCVCAALWQPDHVTITPLRCHKHCLFNTAVLSLSACKRRGGVIVERGRDRKEWERAAKEGFVVLVFSLVEAHYDTVFLRSNRCTLEGERRQSSLTSNTRFPKATRTMVFLDRALCIGGVGLLLPSLKRQCCG